MRSLTAILILITTPLHCLADDVLTACGDPNFPPFTYSNKTNEKVIDGIASDVIRKVLPSQNIQTKNIGNWKRCQVEVQKGNIDIIMGAYWTSSRDTIYLYPNGFLSEDHVSLFRWYDHPLEFKTLNDLKGKKIGTTIGVSLGEKFDNFLAKNAIHEVVPLRHHNYRKMELGRIDFMGDGYYSGMIGIQEAGLKDKIIPFANKLNSEKVYIAFSRKSDKKNLIHELEKNLNTLKSNGEYEAILKHHLSKFGLNDE